MGARKRALTVRRYNVLSVSYHGKKHVREAYVVARRSQAARGGNMNVTQETLEFKDGSVFYGQTIRSSQQHRDNNNNSIPAAAGELVAHGYGVLEHTGFSMEGFFLHGKSVGPGRFKAPNGDLFFGTWSTKNHKRTGKGLSIRAKDGRVLVEHYDEDSAQCLKKRIARKPKGLHWVRPTTTSSSTAAAAENDPTNVKTGAAPAATLAVVHAYKGTEPSARLRHTVSVIIGEGNTAMCLVFGGQATEAIDDGVKHCSASSVRLVPCNDVHVMDLARREWLRPITTGDVPPPMYGHTATVVGSQVVIIGGQQLGMQVSSAVYVLDMNSGTWRCPIRKGYPFVDHTASLISGTRIIVIASGTVFELSLDRWTWTQLEVDASLVAAHRPGHRGAVLARVGHSATVVGNMIFVFGGRAVQQRVRRENDRKYDRCCNTWLVLHVDRLSWEVPSVSSAAPSATPRSKNESRAADAREDHHKALSYSGLLVGGAYDTPRAFHSATLVEERYIVIIGGWTTRNPALNEIDQSYLNDVQVLDVECMTWLRPPITADVPSVFAPRAMHSAVLMPYGTGLVPAASKVDTADASVAQQPPKAQIWVWGGCNAARREMSDMAVLMVDALGKSPPPSSQPVVVEAKEEKVPAADSRDAAAARPPAAVVASAGAAGGAANPPKKRSAWGAPVQVVNPFNKT